MEDRTEREARRVAKRVARWVEKHPNECQWCGLPKDADGFCPDGCGEFDDRNPQDSSYGIDGTVR